MLQLVDQTSSLQCREGADSPSIRLEDSSDASGAIPAQSLDCMPRKEKAFVSSFPAEWADGSQTSSQQKCSPTIGNDKAIRASGDTLGQPFAEEWRPELDCLCSDVKKMRTLGSAIVQLQTHTSAENELVKDYSSRSMNGSRIASNVSNEVTDEVGSEERLGWTGAVRQGLQTKEVSKGLSRRPESWSSTLGITARAGSGERVASQAPGAQAAEMRVEIDPEIEQSWSPEEVKQFAQLLLVYGKDWGRISEELPAREASDLEACFMRPCLKRELILQDEYVESEDSTAPARSCVSRKRDLESPTHPYDESSADEKFDKENCDVCRGGASLPGDLIVYCDSCDVGVHQTCYGLKAVPHGDWLCDRCMEGAADKECFLCTQVGGAMKRMDDHSWVHILCAWLDPDVAISNMDAMSAMKRLPPTEDRSQWVCLFCEKHEGFCLRCGWPGCRTNFHVTCCRRKGYLRLGVELGTLVIEAYCDRHRKRRAGYKAVIRSMERRCEDNLPLRRRLRKIKSSARAGKLTIQAFTDSILAWAAQLEATKKQALSDGLKDCSSKSSLKRRLALLNRIVSRGERANQIRKPNGDRARREQGASSIKVYMSENQLQGSKMKKKKRKRVENEGTSSKTVSLVAVVQNGVHSNGCSTAKEGVYSTADSKLQRNIDQCQSQGDLIDACDICMNGISMEEDLIVFCDRCDVGVHQSCYGLKVVPPGEWLCRVCESERSATRDNPKALVEIRCAICLMSGGAMKRMTEESGKQWVHVLCAWVDPDVQIMDTNNMENAKFVHQPSMARKKLVCCFCLHKGGLCIQCMNPECFRPFHPRCARVGGYLRLEMEFGSFVVEAYCDKHRDSRADSMSVLAFLEDHIESARVKGLWAEGEEILAELAALKDGVAAGRFTTVEEFETELRRVFELLTSSPPLSGQVGLITIVDEARNRLKRLKSYLSGAYWVGPGKRVSQQTKADVRIVSATSKEQEDGDDEGLSSSRCTSAVAKEEERRADGFRSPWRKRRAQFRDIIMDKHIAKIVDHCSQKLAIDGLSTIDCAKTAHPQLRGEVAAEADTRKPIAEDAPARDEREGSTLGVADAVDDENFSRGGAEITLEDLPKVAAAARRPPPASTIRRRETLEWMMMLLSVQGMQTGRFSDESIADLATICHRARADKCASVRLEALISCAKRGVGPAVGMAWRLLRDYARVLSLQGTISMAALTEALKEEAPDAKVSPSRTEKGDEVMPSDAVWQQPSVIPVLPTYRLLGARTVWTLQKLFHEEEVRQSRIHMKRRLSMVTRGPVGEHGGNIFCHSNAFAVHQVGGRRRYARGLKIVRGGLINKRAGRVRRWHSCARRSNMLRFQLHAELYFLMHISPSTIASAFAAIPKQKVRPNGKVAKQGQKGMATALIHRMACGNCTNCCRPDCESCYSCTNNKHDGRPSTRQRCIYRLCLTPLKKKVSRSPTKKPTNGATIGRVTL